MQCTNCGAEVQPGATVCPSCEERLVPSTQAVATPRKRPVVAAAKPVVAKAPKATKAPRDPSAPPAWVRPVPVLVGVVLLAAAGWFIYSFLNAGPNTPDAAVVRFMQSYAVYDARGMLDNSTHASFTATDQASFESEMARVPAEVKAVPLYKDIRVSSVTIQPDDASTAVVRFSAMMLATASASSSQSTSTPAPVVYSPREETLTVVKSSAGKWLVKWN